MSCSPIVRIFASNYYNTQRSEMQAKQTFSKENESISPEI